MEITNNKYNTMPEQVQENKDNIKVLAEYIKEAFNATVTIAQDATTLDASNVRDWVAGTTTGFILDQAGKLFKIIAVSDNTIYIQWWASLPQGATGATGAKGDKGDAGVGFNNTTDINLVVGEPSVIYDTEDGITITSQGNIIANGETFTPTVENRVPLIAGNGLTMDATEDGKHVDMHLSAETQMNLSRTLKTPVSAPSATELVAIDNTNSQTMLTIGDGLIIENGIIKSTGSSGGEVSQTDFDNLVNNTTQINSDSNGNLFMGGTTASRSYTNTTCIGHSASVLGAASTAIGARAEANSTSVTSVGYNANSSNSYSTVIGSNAVSRGNMSIAIGYGASVGAVESIQIGQGVNQTSGTLQINDDNIYNHETHTLTVQNIELNGKAINLYRHIIRFNNNNDIDIKFEIINNSSTQISTTTDLSDLLASQNIQVQEYNTDSAIICSGRLNTNDIATSIILSSDSSNIIVQGYNIYFSNNANILASTDQNISVSTENDMFIRDTVYKLL